MKKSPLRPPKRCRDIVSTMVNVNCKQAFFDTYPCLLCSWYIAQECLSAPKDHQRKQMYIAMTTIMVKMLLGLYVLSNNYLKHQLSSLVSCPPLSLSLSLSPTPKVLSTYFHSLHAILLYCGSHHHPSRTSPEIAMSIDIPTGTDAMSDTYSPSYLVPN